MFSGIVESVGRVVEHSLRAGSARISVEATLPGDPVREGESVAVDGACLTATRIHAGRMEFDVVAETLERTTLGQTGRGRRVNLERSLRIGDRISGHLVQGHVDAKTRVLELCRKGDDHRVRLALGPEFSRFVVLKGSVTLQGVSLTVSGVDPEGFEVALVPFTLERTTLGDLRTGDEVNVEADLIARYLEGMIVAGGAAGRPGRGPAEEGL